MPFFFSPDPSPPLLFAPPPPLPPSPSFFSQNGCLKLFYFVLPFPFFKKKTTLILG